MRYLYVRQHITKERKKKKKELSALQAYFPFHSHDLQSFHINLYKNAYRVFFHVLKKFRNPELFAVIEIIIEI